MTAEQLEELLRIANSDRWVRGVNDYGNPVARLNYGGIYGTQGEAFKAELDLIMLTPSLARRVLAAEKLVEAANNLVAHDKWGSVNYTDNAMWKDADLLKAALTAYREACN